MLDGGGQLSPHPPLRPARQRWSSQQPCPCPRVICPRRRSPAIEQAGKHGSWHGPGTASCSWCGGGGALPPDDVGDGVLAEAEFALDQAVAAALGDEGEDLRRRRSDFGRCPGCRPSFLPRALAAAMPERTRSRMSSRSNSAMPAMTVASIRPCGVGTSKVRPLMAITETRRASRSCSVQQIEGAAASTRQFGHQHHVGLAPLRQGHDLAPLGAVDPRAGGSFPEHPDHRVAAARGKGRQVALLPLVGLVGGRDPPARSPCFGHRGRVGLPRSPDR